MLQNRGSECVLLVHPSSSQYQSCVPLITVSGLDNLGATVILNLNRMYQSINDLLRRTILDLCRYGR
jgi:hypothetical protein